MLSGKRILLGVTGGIAAYKAVYLLREFQKSGAAVRVVMTPAATRFIGTETFSALSRSSVAVDVFNDEDPGESWTKHIHWGEWADLFVVAPCTANTLAKIVHGQSDNMLTSTVLAARCPILICPTMDGEMYESPAVSKNLESADTMGFYILEPDTGYLASGLEDVGRLPEIPSIINKSADIIETYKIVGPLSGKKIVVTAGPTREFIDPVRFISNPSSGKMGAAMAEAAYKLGGDVTLLCGPGVKGDFSRFKTESFTSADDLFNLVKDNAKADVFIKAAAVSDFKPKTSASQKVKKSDAELHIPLSKNPDILEWLGKQKSTNQVLIGFAMETENLVKNATSKLKAKNLDWICANSLIEKDSGFESESNSIQLIGKDVHETFKGPKSEIAHQILNRIFGQDSI